MLQGVGPEVRTLRQPGLGSAEGMGTLTKVWSGVQKSCLNPPFPDLPPCCV